MEDSSASIQLLQLLKFSENVLLFSVSLVSVLCERTYVLCERTSVLWERVSVESTQMAKSAALNSVSTGSR